MNCRDINHLLYSSDAGALTPAQNDSIHAHLASCQACNEERTGWREIAALQVPATPAGLRLRIAAALPAPSPVPMWRPLRPFLFGGALIAGTALAATVAWQIASRAPDPVVALHGPSAGVTTASPTIAPVLVTQSQGGTPVVAPHGGQPSEVAARAVDGKLSPHGQGGEVGDDHLLAQEMDRGRYPDLQKELGLSQAEADALLVMVARGATEYEIEAQLGPTMYQLWKDYQTTMDSNRRVNTLRNNLAVSGDPLRDDQARALAVTILAEQRRRNAEMKLRGYPTSDPRVQLDLDAQNITITEASYRRIVDAAKSYLSAQQLFLMQNSMNQLIVSQRREVDERRAMLEGRQPGEASPR